MTSIDISTTHNVTIEYELAGWGERAMAFVLDLFILVTGGSILITAFSSLFGNYQLMLMVTYFILIPAISMYSFYSEMLSNGRTLGKAIVGIRVVKLNGSEPTMSDYTMRWALRLVDIWLSAGTIATILTTSSPKNQRLGDMLAGTAVIKMKPRLMFSLNDIAKINTLENYEPTYPDVVHFSERDMLLMKSTLERYVKYPNLAHANALTLLADKACEKLQIPRVKTSNNAFIKTLINDYIVLTRS